jgi:archaellum component FlaC
MGFLTMKGRGTDSRLDSVIDAVAMTQGHADALNDWVSEVEAQIAQTLKTHAEQMQQTNTRLSEINDLKLNISKVESEVARLAAKPEPVIPLVPDINPIRSELRLIKDVIDEINIAHNEEMTHLWKSLSDIHECRREIEKVSRNVATIKIPSLTPLYWLAGSAIIIGVLGLVF